MAYIYCNNIDTKIDITNREFNDFCSRIATAKSVVLGRIYKVWIRELRGGRKTLLLEDLQLMHQIAGDLMIILTHSEDRGNIYPKEARLLYLALSKVKIKSGLFHWNCKTKKQQDLLRRLKVLCYNSWKNRRVIMFK